MDSKLRRQPAGRLVQWAGTAIVAAVLAVGAAGCSSDPASTAPDVAGAYAVVIQWFVDHSAGEQERPVVFVEALGEGVSIGLDTQAAVVEAADATAEVRFIDDRSEALGDDGVNDDGLFVALGPAVEDGVTLTIDSDQIVSESTRTSWQFRLVDRDEKWVLSGEPVHVP